LHDNTDWRVFIIRCDDGSLQAGVSTDVDRRFGEHLDQRDELMTAVLANEVPLEYLVFPDEGHGFTRKTNRIACRTRTWRFSTPTLRPADTNHAEERRDARNNH
jgi:hypothetical protein